MHAWMEFHTLIDEVEPVSGALDPTTTLQLFELYEEWQQITAAKLASRQVVPLCVCVWVFVMPLS